MAKTQEHPDVALAPDFDKRTQQFVMLRDKIDKIKKKHTEELKPYNDAKAMMESYFLQQLDTMGVSSISSDHGTVYKTTKSSATIADGEAFRAYVQENNAWELADLRANGPAVREFVEANEVQPPGINYSTHTTVGCRRGK